MTKLIGPRFFSPVLDASWLPFALALQFMHPIRLIIEQSLAVFQMITKPGKGTTLSQIICSHKKTSAADVFKLLFANIFKALMLSEKNNA